MNAVGSSVDLIQAQLRAMQAWNTALAAAERARAVASATRETRMDLSRRMDVLREQHATIIARTTAQLRDAGDLLLSRPPLRAVIAHRNDWFAHKISAGLHAGGVQVIARVANGAQAVGCAVVEQPDLLLVEDVLPMLSGVDVVREVRGYAPATRIGAHVAYPEHAVGLLDAGADAAWSRQVPPVDVSHGLLSLLAPSRQLS